MRKKDAYLILAHKTDYCFIKLLKLLDSDYCDIYIHMDKKDKDFIEDDIKKIVKKSNIYFIKRQKCNWGGFSLVRAELNLLKEAKKNEYRYYHLISGQDLPLKSQREISKFFEKNDSLYIDIQSEKFKFSERIMYYYPFQEFLGRKSITSVCGKVITKVCIMLQKLLKIDRINEKNFQKGNQWFSITNDFVKYIIENENIINKMFNNTFCSDELFIQTVLINSPFKDKVFSKKYNDPICTLKRNIDWNRGNPYVWKNDDFNELINSDALFARKFDSNTDKEIIDNIYNYIRR